MIGSQGGIATGEGIVKAIEEQQADLATFPLPDEIQAWQKLNYALSLPLSPLSEPLSSKIFEVHVYAPLLESSISTSQALFRGYVIGVSQIALNSLVFSLVILGFTIVAIKLLSKHKE
jgi:hypothetical protein